jgi:hypothetical protein
MRSDHKGNIKAAPFQFRNHVLDRGNFQVHLHPPFRFRVLFFVSVPSDGPASLRGLPRGRAASSAGRSSLSNAEQLTPNALASACTLPQAGSRTPCSSLAMLN